MATFGAPIGGVLFSIEVISTFYVVNNLWKAFFCSIWCCVMFTVLQYTAIADSLSSGHFLPFQFDREVGLYAGLGLICGLIGALFVHLTYGFICIRKHALVRWTTHRYRYTLLVAGLCALCTYQAGYLQLSDKDVLRSMFRDIEDKERDQPWEEPSTGFNLLIFTLCKLLMTALSYSTPVPCGIFIPTFTAGATLGRLYGYILGKVGSTAHIGVYAVVGAAALTSSVTHTLSVAVIVFELTGDMHYMLPMLIAVLLAYAVGSALSASVYDCWFDMKRLPYLPTVKSQHLYSLRAADFLNFDQPLAYLTQNSDLMAWIEKLEAALSSGLRRMPMVDEEMTLIADYPTDKIRKHVLFEYSQVSKDMPLTAKGKLDDYFLRLMAYRQGGSEVEKGGEVVPGFAFSEVLSELPEVRSCFARTVDCSSVELAGDAAPLIVAETMSLGKVHFLLMMLGAQQLYVTRKGALVGVITRDSFSKHGT